MLNTRIKNMRVGVAAIAMAVAVAVSVVPAPALGRDLLFLGVTDSRGVPSQPELERELRAELAAAGRFRLVGGVETERVVREMERQGRSLAEGIIPRSIRLADSTVVVRGVLKELSIVPKRSALLLWGKIDARMRIEVFFGETGGAAPHRGEFGAEASRRKDIILFMDPKKGVHVSAADREELLAEMRAKLVKDVAGLAAAFFNAVSAPPGPPPGKGGADSAAAGAGTEFSTIDGGDVTPIDSAGAQ